VTEPAAGGNIDLSSDRGCFITSAMVTAVASIASFFPPGADFDAATIRIMSEAFDTACLTLSDEQQPHTIREAIALRIIEAIIDGERNPARLRDIGLNGFLRRRRARLRA
jgi:hypothetical protein